VDDRNEIAATLRQAREQRELTVEAAAAEAGIPVRYARLLEGEAPSGVGISDELYLIPFFRRYARALGLPAEDLLPDFLGRVQELPPPSAPPLNMRGRSSRRRMPWRALAVVATVALASLIIMEQAPERPSFDDEHGTANRASDTVAADEKPPAPVPSAAPRDAADAPEVAAHAAVEHAPDAAPPAPAQPAARPVSAEQDVVVGPPSPPPTAPQAQAAAVADTGEPAAGAHELRVSAAQETWFSLGIDDEPKRNIILQPGETRSWTAARGFVLTVGNAGGITVAVDGRELPPLGRAGQVVRNLRLPPEPPPASG